MTRFFDLLSARLPGARLYQNEPMAARTTFRVGGPADALLEAASVEELCQALRVASASGVPVLVMGNGSNLIVRDGGIRGLVVVLGDAFSEVSVKGCSLHAQAGARLSRIAAVAQGRGLAGLEFASGIPGTVGGGAAMNAGAYGGCLSDVLTEALVLKNAEPVVFSKDDMEYGNRTSSALKNGHLVLTATFALTPDDPARIQARMDDFAQRRRDKQPLSYPSAGSVFKRPQGHFAGALIEAAGLKGKRIGGAMVSKKHAGFIVNAGGATAADVLSMIEYVRETVRARSGVTLECEVRIVGEEA